FGSDKPDLRFELELVDLAPNLEGGSGFRVFDDALAAGGRVKAIAVPGMGGATRREIDELVERAKRFGAKGLAHLAVGDAGSVSSPIAKFLGDERASRLAARAGAGGGDLVLIVADRAEVTNDVLG